MAPMNVYVAAHTCPAYRAFRTGEARHNAAERAPAISHRLTFHGLHESLTVQLRLHRRDTVQILPA